MFPRLILLGVLVIAIIVIASRSVRTWNTELPEVSELDRLETVVATSSEGLVSRSGDLESEDNQTPQLPGEGTFVEIPSGTHYLSTSSPSTVTSAVPTPAIVLETPATETSIATSAMNARSIHNDMVELEWIMRKYLSGGHKISKMNFNTLREYGYLPPERYSLTKLYNIGFQPSGEGFDLWIEPKFELPDELKSSLLKMQNVKLMDGKVRYVFWIRAYR